MLMRSLPSIIFTNSSMWQACDSALSRLSFLCSNLTSSICNKHSPYDTAIMFWVNSYLSFSTQCLLPRTSQNSPCVFMLSKFGKLNTATGLEKVSFHSNSKERQCQRMLRLPHNCTHLTYEQSNSQNSPGQGSTVREPLTSSFSSWIQKRQRNQRSNSQHPLNQ